MFGLVGITAGYKRVVFPASYKLILSTFLELRNHPAADTAESALVSAANRAEQTEA